MLNTDISGCSLQFPNINTDRIHPTVCKQIFYLLYRETNQALAVSLQVADFYHAKRRSSSMNRMRFRRRIIGIPSYTHNRIKFHPRKGFSETWIRTWGIGARSSTRPSLIICGLCFLPCMFNQGVASVRVRWLA